MIGEYALEPKMVARWGEPHNYRYYFDKFGLGQGRIISRYPKKWARQVWESFGQGSEMDKKRLVELLMRLQETMVKRREYIWDNDRPWLENALQEHARHPFRAILASENPSQRPEVLTEEDLFPASSPGWNSPHGRVVSRRPQSMAGAVRELLTCCHWVRFVDPHISPGRDDYRRSLRAFLEILACERPVGPPKSIEIHTSQQEATLDFLRQSYGELIPPGLQVTLYQWEIRAGGQRLHNRYILTDIGGVAFHHGLDPGNEGETDDITRLDLEQYNLRCRQYQQNSSSFQEASQPITLTGIHNGES